MKVKNSFGMEEEFAAMDHGQYDRPCVGRNNYENFPCPLSQARKFIDSSHREKAKSKTESVHAQSVQRIGYDLDNRGSRVRFPVRAGSFSLHHRPQNGSGIHPASCSVVN
jgi:hypothetical protein